MLKRDETDLMANNKEDLIVNDNDNLEGSNDQQEEVSIVLLSL